MTAAAVAYSGGRDSTALLHATLGVARAAGLQVHALHVHHGLSPHADAWLAHCQRTCRRWARRGWPVQFHHVRLQLQPGPGDSVEALARQARYEALAGMARAQGCDLVLLAHHREDQAETFLLQALRGAGVAGLASMPVRVQRQQLWWCRPWLQQPRALIEAYVRRHRLRFVDDDSNEDVRWARNRLRRQVWPALTAAFPQAAQVLGDAARWAQQAQDCLQALAALDLAALQAGPQALRLEALWALGEARGVNALRAWLQQRLAQAPTAALLQRLWRELPGEAPAVWSVSPHAELRRYRGELRWRPVGPQRSAPPALQVMVAQAGDHAVPAWGGCLRVQAVAEGGVPLAVLQPVSLRARRGGEQFQSRPDAPPRALKKQYQALALPAWERDGPLLFSGDRLVFVPGLGLDARALALNGQPRVMLQWLADPFRPTPPR